MRLRASSVALAALLLAPGSSTAFAQVVDQANYANFQQFGQADGWNGQTFRPSALTSIGAAFNLWDRGLNPFSSTLTIQLWSDVPSNAGATLLASGSSFFSLAAGEQRMVDVFWSAVGVTPGQQYFLAMIAQGGGFDIVTTASFPNSGYAGGSAFDNFNSSVTSPYTNFQDVNSGYDLTFAAYTATPEPANVILMVTGLAGVAVVARRRVKRAA
jgi:hypothetical protein